ncbi:MAG: alpha/beta fold hydrolase [Asticcacaulis sp.]
MSKRFVAKPSRYHFAIWVAIAVAVFVACTSGAKSATPFPNAEQARFSVEVVGQDAGKAPDLILIPGLNSSREVWDATAEQLKSRYRLHILNLSGFAGEPAAANRTGPVIDPVVEALDAYIRQNRLKDPIIIGHSLGGLTGLRLATRHPSSLSKLIIVDALPFIGVLFDPAADAQTIVPRANQMRDAMLAGDDAAHAARVSESLKALPEPKTEAERNTQRITRWMLTSDRYVSAQAFYDDMLMDLRPDLAKITVPVVVFVPHHATMPYTAEQTTAFYGYQYSGTKQLRLLPIADSRHFIMYDQPQVFAAALDAALQ